MMQPTVTDLALDGDEMLPASSPRDAFPTNWFIASDLDPKSLIKKVKRTSNDGRDTSYDYLNVQNRMLWFIRDQRELIGRGLAVTTYIVKTEMVEHDREKQWAHFKTYVRDVLGNETIMYGQAKFKANVPDYPEMASTKSLGRALLMLGYGTGFAPEMDEDEDNLADAPVEHREPRERQRRDGRRDQRTPGSRGNGSARVTPMMTDAQRDRIKGGCETLGWKLPADLSFYTQAQAQQLLDDMTKAYHKREQKHQQAQQAQQKQLGAPPAQGAAQPTPAQP